MFPYNVSDKMNTGRLCDHKIQGANTDDNAVRYPSGLHFSPPGSILIEAENVSLHTVAQPLRNPPPPRRSQTASVPDGHPIPVTRAIETEGGETGHIMKHLTVFEL